MGTLDRCLAQVVMFVISTSTLPPLRSSVSAAATAYHADQCTLSLVESIPENLSFPAGSPTFPSTFDVWLSLIGRSQRSLDIASFYWTLLADDLTPAEISGNASWMGEQVFVALELAGLANQTHIRIVQNAPSSINPSRDTTDLLTVGAAQVRSLNMTSLLGAGVLHTKFWIVDDRDIYVGSANMDFRSLSQVKELGLVVYDCPTLAIDLKKVFEVYWMAAGLGQLPKTWPDALATNYNEKTPLAVVVNGSSDASSVFISSSPPPFSPKGRADDLKSIVAAIDEAREFVYVAVMDFYPQFIYGSGPRRPGRLWTPLDEALRRAAVERGVEVRLLVSEWKSTRPTMLAFAASLDALSSAFPIRVRKFIVPPLPTNRTIPFTRVNHNKYMVTERQAFVGTSNWSGDYFVQTAGIGLHVSNSSTLLRQLKSVFERDWSSKFSYPIRRRSRTLCPTNN